MAKTAYDIIMNKIVRELKLSRNSELFLPANVRPEKYLNKVEEGRGGNRFWKKTIY